MKYLFFIGLIMLFSGCKTPKNERTDYRLNEQKNIEYDVHSYTDSTFSEAVERVVNTLINEKFDISIQHTEYDTDKPIDPATGTPPKRSETKTNISGQRDTRQNENLTANQSGGTSSQYSDNTKDKGKTQVTDKTQSEQGMSKIARIFIIIGFVSVGYVILTNYKKLKKWLGL